jgi:SPP1 gp7 family putative phage head morphogenesis protein|nr:MAG TPA: minor capsid protein [Caudoviricetes sp.]DAW17998.1 MAG TPA: minor capsid protein [Caudoviricetes sp.]
MATSDLGHKLTNKELAKLERRIAKLYREAGKELQATIDSYFEQFKKRDEEMKALIGTVQNGKEWTEADYKRWRLNQIGRGERYQAMRDKVAHRVTDANAVAVSYTNDATPGIYSLNRNYSAYTIEQVAGNIGFDLWDEQTVKRLMVEQPELMPYYPPKRALKRGIDLAYGKKQITASVTSSILQGKSIKHMADDLQKRITTMSRDSAIRTARTAVTGAQNAGRMDSYAAAEKMGIKLKKEWLATLDARTRHSHAMIDGEQVAQDKKFSNGCRFPGDPQGPPWEIYNCRCTLIAAVEGVDTSTAQRRARNADTGKTEVISNMTYAEWAGWKKDTKQVASAAKSDIIKAKPEIKPVTLSLSNLEELEKWQNEYYATNSSVEFTKKANPNISKYSGGAYSAINAIERGGAAYEKALRCYGNLDGYKEISDGVSAEISKFKLSTDLNVKRVVGDVGYITGGGSSVDDMVASIGKLYTEKGFTSTTIAQDAQLPFGGHKDTQTVLDIIVPKSTRGAYIYKMADNPAEFEFLIDRGTTYKVLDAGERTVKKSIFDLKSREFVEKEVPERYMKLEVVSQ